MGFGIAIVTVPFIVGLMIGASGESIVAWTVMGSLPVLIGMIARRMRGRSGAAWWLLSLVLMSAFYAVSAVYLLPMGERTLYSGLGGAMLLGALPLLIIVWPSSQDFHGEAFELTERFDIGLGASLGLLGWRRKYWPAALVAGPGGTTAVSDTTIGLDQIEEEMLAYEVSDAALETAAGTTRAGNYTLFFCTALDMCPGP